MLVKNIFLIWFVLAASLSLYLHLADIQYDHGGFRGLLFLSVSIWGFLIWLPGSVIHEFNLIPSEYQLVSSAVLGFFLAIILDRAKNLFFNK